MRPSLLTMMQVVTGPHCPVPRRLHKEVGLAAALGLSFTALCKHGLPRAAQVQCKFVRAMEASPRSPSQSRSASW